MPNRSLATKRIRKNFGKILKIVDIPDLIGVQRESFGRFLQKDVAPEKRIDIGLQSVYNSVFFLLPGHILLECFDHLALV